MWSMLKLLSAREKAALWVQESFDKVFMTKQWESHTPDGTWDNTVCLKETMKYNVSLREITGVILVVINTFDDTHREIIKKEGIHNRGACL